MLPEGAIQATNVWKRFRADRRRRLLRDHLNDIGSRLRRRGEDAWRWALRDVDLVAKPGESIGLIGANGSGKTTLLKILTRVMYPYAGRVQVRGRVGALIEVKAGIHPDLTGRENVFLYGSLLGLRRREVATRFDDIVSFAELDDAIDRQVKFYSSGMQMRLGFAVAAFLEPDVLLVDEVLAVGDASFQQKCLDRMRHVLTQGSTVVFVSHDLGAVEATCSRGIWLRHGSVQADGPIKGVVGGYRQSVEEGWIALPAAGHDPSGIRLASVEVVGDNGKGARTDCRLELRIRLRAAGLRWGNLCVGVSEGPATPVFLLRRDMHFQVGEIRTTCVIPHLPLPRGRFFVWIGAFDTRGRDLMSWQRVKQFDVTGPDLDATPPAIVRLAPVQVQASWTID